jgi:hypothetical protein
MKKISFIILFLSIIIVSCKRDHDQVPNSDYLIFGHFYGECGGENYIEIFKLGNDNLFEDTKDQYPNTNSFYDGSYVKLSDEKFNLTKDLMDFFPYDLLNETNTVIGQTDAGDWGGLYIEYNFNGTRKFWLMDLMKTNVPAKYHNFIDKIVEKTDQLK